MRLYSGPRWKDGVPTEGWVRVERGRVLDEGDGLRTGARPAVLLDGLHNYHTHLGDAFLAGRAFPRSLQELVRPGTGYKHRMLARASRATILNGVRRALRSHAEAGTASVLDFREQGLQGVRWVRRVERALGRDSPTVRLLGRPVRGAVRPSEIDSLLDDAQGIGLPSLGDVGNEAARTAARLCHARRRAFALHASEGRREDIESILALEPDLLVHLCSATKRDLQRVADAGVPVAVCPTSNAFFRLRPPLRELHGLGVSFFLGTDNAMLGSTDLVDEASLARRWAPRIADEAWFRALTTPPEKSINRVQPLNPRSAAGRLVVLLRRGTRARWDGSRILARR